MLVRQSTCPEERVAPVSAPPGATRDPQAKLRHIDACLEQPVEYRKTTGFERFDFLEEALPELSLAELDLSCMLAGKRMRAPLMISPMTGGTDPYFWDFLTEELMNVYPRLLDSSIANEWVGYRAEPPDFLPVLGETPVEGYMLAAGAGGNGVIEAPTIGRDLARFIMTGEKSWYLERLPFARFKDAEEAKAKAQQAKLQR